MAGLLDYVFNSPRGAWSLGLLALGQMPKSQEHAGTDGPPWHRRTSSKEQSRQRMAGRNQGRQRKEWAQADKAAESRPNECRSKPLLADGSLLYDGGLWAARLPVDGAGGFPAGGAFQNQAAAAKFDGRSESSGSRKTPSMADHLNGGKGIAEMPSPYAARLTCRSRTLTHTTRT